MYSWLIDKEGRIQSLESVTQEVDALHFWYVRGPVRVPETQKVCHRERLRSCLISVKFCCSVRVDVYEAIETTEKVILCFQCTCAPSVKNFDFRFTHQVCIYFSYTYDNFYDKQLTHLLKISEIFLYHFQMILKASLCVHEVYKEWIEIYLFWKKRNLI